MKKVLQITAVLSWINLVSCALLMLGGLGAILISANVITLLLSVILPGSVILHSYAALQLRKSIRQPELPLNRQTITGLRLMGMAALFFAFMSIGNGIVILQHAPEAAKQMKLPVETKGMDIVAIFRASGVFTLLISACIVVNVLLNFRLMKAYLISLYAKDDPS